MIKTLFNLWIFKKIDNKGKRNKKKQPYVYNIKKKQKNLIELKKFVNKLNNLLSNIKMKEKNSMVVIKLEIWMFNAHIAIHSIEWMNKSYHYQKKSVIWYMLS